MRLDLSLASYNIETFMWYLRQSPESQRNQNAEILGEGMAEYLEHGWHFQTLE